MSLNPEELQEKEELQERPADELTDFIDILNCVVYYYASSIGGEDTDSSESWKSKAGMIKKAVPEDVDDLIKLAFIKQLKRFS